MRLTLAGEILVSNLLFTYMGNTHLHRQVFGKAIVEHADNDGAIRLVPPWSEQSMADGGLVVSEKLGKLITAWDEWGGGR